MTTQNQPEPKRKLRDPIFPVGNGGIDQDFDAFQDGEPLFHAGGQRYYVQPDSESRLQAYKRRREE